MSTLDPLIETELRNSLKAVATRGELLSEDELKERYSSFRSRFGPEVLALLHGEELLRVMHTHGNKESLVYWLEFKNDDEFPGTRFGSIAGGSAHKFGLFRRKDTTQWVSGSPLNENNVTETEAIAIATKHRDQLLAGTSVLERLPVNSDSYQYAQLQSDLNRVSPDVCNLAWGHKYFSLIFPQKLDDFHNHRWQRFNLIKLLQLPPKEEGLYPCAGQFVRLANELGVPMNHLTTALNERDGQPVSYWRIGTRLGQKESIWSAMRDGGYAAIGWTAVGDLSDLVADSDSKETIRKRLEVEYSTDVRMASRKAGEVNNFLKKIEEGDIVVAADGHSVLGIGRVEGGYGYYAGESAPHRRFVSWLSTEAWSMPVSDEGNLTTIFKLGKHERNLVEIERHLLGRTHSDTKPSLSGQLESNRLLKGIPGRIQSILSRKGQAILFGPPGTGKTYWARKTALDLAAIGSFNRSFDELSDGERMQIEGTAGQPGLVRSCTFHPSYGYEDFLEGYRPQLNSSGTLSFVLRDGIFKKLCAAAKDDPRRKYFLIVDEINRGDIARIFGELFTLLESDKRNLSVTLPVSQESFCVPPNVHIIGTMNTADRSIALLDTALRRRFGFIELMPDVTVLGVTSVDNCIPLAPWLSALNERIRAHLGRDARNLQIGHAYFIEYEKPVTDLSKFTRIIAEDIVPLIEEYCYENYGALAQILGKEMVDEAKQRIREEIYLPSRRSEFVQALLSPSPDIVTSNNAVLVSQVPPSDSDLDVPDELKS
jgi:5-methylcytosine-specific restriction protein B